jgi:hypothetical protein
MGMEMPHSVAVLVNVEVNALLAESADDVGAQSDQHHSPNHLEATGDRAR